MADDDRDVDIHQRDDDTYVVGGEPTNNNLPQLHESDEGGALARMRERLSRLDGPMSPSNATVPLEANDVGDVSLDPNPRACDLEDSDLDFDTGYVEGYECSVEHEHGRVIVAAVPSTDGTTESDSTDSDKDGPNSVLGGSSNVNVDEDTFIDDLTEWA